MFRKLDKSFKKNSYQVDTIALIKRHLAAKTPPERLLSTESPHPATTDLSKYAREDLEEGYRLLQKVDKQALERLLQFEAKINQLSQTFFNSLSSGSNIRIGGCGSAARTAMLAERMFREAFPRYTNQVIVMIAGGDLALVRAVEGFEDHPEYGQKQLELTGWKPNDLYVGVSASGAAGFVNGQVEYVLSKEHSCKPIFFICNPLSECLDRFAEDPKTVFHKSKCSNLKAIDFLDVCVGEMALSGSTRMQAATVQLVVLGFALLQAGQQLTGRPAISLRDFVLCLQKFLVGLPVQELSELTHFETDVYAKGNYAIYRANAAEALTVVTDTTERSPTFNWPYFENDADEVKSEKLFSQCRVIVNEQKENKDALQAMLGRELRTLDWPDSSSKQNESKTSLSYLLGYDFTENIIQKRKQTMPGANPAEIKIQIINHAIQIQFSKKIIKIPLPYSTLPTVLHPLFHQLTLKILLNSHSTLVAGRIGCYTGNLMTSMRTSNEKLINRAVALTRQLIVGTDFSKRRLPLNIKDRIPQNEILETLYRMMLVYQYGDSIVFNTRNAILTKYEQLCYLWIFHHVQQPSATLLKHLFFSRNSEVNEAVPLVNDVELAVALTEKKRDIVCFEGGGTYFRFSVLTANNEFHSLQYMGNIGHTLKLAGGNCNAIGWEKFFTLTNDALENIRINHNNLSAFIQHEKPIIVIGMAGMGAEGNRQKLQAHLVEKLKVDRKHILITTDADTYLAALPSHGAVLIAGTGSVCLGLNGQGERIQTGGLGAHLSADPGSAFAVGRYAVLDCLTLTNKGKIWDEPMKAFIGNDDPLCSSLMKRLEEILTVPRSQFVAHLNREHADRIKMAELAPIVFDYAFEQKPSSPLARKIIREITNELAVQLGGAINPIIEKKSTLRREPFHVLLVGGIFENKHRNQVIQLIEHQIAKMCPGIHVRWEHEPAENYVARMVQKAVRCVPTVRSSFV